MRIFQGDIGKTFRIDTGIDLIGFTLAKLLILTPLAVEKEWTDITVESGDINHGETAGKTIIEYISKAGDLDIAGTYLLMAYVEFGEASKHLGETTKFYVHKKFQ